MKTKVLIAGAGLSGLYTAYQCHLHGIDYQLVEARPRLGGRVFSFQENQNKYDCYAPAIDLGPSWFWPGQHRMLALVDELGLTGQMFLQQDEGLSLYEDQYGNIHRGVEGFSMTGAYRLNGGMQAVTAGLGARLAKEKVWVDASLVNINLEGDVINAVVNHQEQLQRVECEYIILAMPPRIAINTIQFNPEFSQERQKTLSEIVTWMAGQAKMVCLYDHAFWKKQGFSGDVISQLGPLQEIHDASVQSDSLKALFGFVAVPPDQRRQRGAEIQALALQQLARLFGNDALNPRRICLQDWSQEKYTATQWDQQISGYHPSNDISYVEEPEWGKKIIWSGSESADYRQHNNGFLEGALQASMHAFSLIRSQRR